MTYKELRDQLNRLDDEQLNMDVTIYDVEFDEFYGCYSPNLQIYTSDDVLDEGHPYLSIKKPDE